MINFSLMIDLLEPYPTTMKPKDIADFLGVSEGTAYKIVQQENFPKLQIESSRLYLIPKHKFAQWYLDNSVTE